MMNRGPETYGIGRERENVLPELLIFEKKLAKEPVDIKEGIYYFDAHNHGDWFDEEDIAEWDNGRWRVIGRNRLFSKIL